MIYETREDSYLLAKYVKEYASGRVLDMGCGPGILAEIALGKTNDVLAVDVDEEAVNFCKAKGINARVSDLFSNVNGKFDLIIFNPPYLPEDKDEDEESRRAISGGKIGSELLERFLKNARSYLNEGGKILIVVSTLTGNVGRLFKNYNFKILEEHGLFFERLIVYLIYYKYMNKMQVLI